MKWGLSRWRQENAALKSASVSSGGFSLGESLDKDGRANLSGTGTQVGTSSEHDISSGKLGAVRSEERKAENTDISGVATQEAVSSQAPFVVPAGYRISGTIFCARPVEVRGECAGQLRTSGDVTVCAGGAVSGEIQARRIIVFGDVRDRIAARESINLQSGGRIMAPLTTPALSVAPGGILATDSVTVGYEPQG
jgi:cytoskeletal protein CcmA (bactofilin family)